ncbi:MAG: LysM peptidoglycan-binding domain-containing protein [Deltaproteobacteria bacterium]|nr:MAG: LysM peptidoglycan-binding domain-containing protein [Deltaproteobacteria bacterium]
MTPMSRRAPLATAAVALAIAAVAPSVARAQKLDTIRVKVRKGDTLELLAAEYYGDRQHAVFIMKANGMTHPRKLKPGERLRIPIQRELTTEAGDTFAELAERYMGDARRAEFLAAFNNLPAGTTLPAGLRLFVPFHVTHTAQATETLESIAAAYLGDRDKASLLKRYNFTDADQLERGDKIVIPIFNVRVRRERLPAIDDQSAARERRRHEMEQLAERALPAARAALREGDFAAIKKALVELDLDYLPSDLAADVGILLGTAYMAFDDEDSARAVFEKALARAPDRALSAYDHSPKVRALWTRLGGKVTDGRP